MFRNAEDAPKSIKTINCLLSDGGMGDLLCALVAIDYIIKNYPWVNLLIWVPDYLLDFAKNVLPANAIVRNYTDAKKKYDDKRIGISTRICSQHTPAKIHPVDYAFHMLADEHVDITKKNYLKLNPIDVSHFELPVKYVVIASTAAEVVKTMPSITINEIASYVISRGYTPVFVGRTETAIGYEDIKMQAKAADINYSVGVNLIDKTNLVELGSIIEGAKCYVGMDGGVTHIAGFTNVPIIVGYTFINPQHNLPIRNHTIGYNCYRVTPPVSLGCRFCQTNMNFVYGLDYRSCFYKDYKCTTYMTSDKFIKHLENIL